MKNGNGRKSAPKTAVSPISGSRIPLGNHPGNTGGKPGRSGRRPQAITVACQQIVDKYKLLEVVRTIAQSAEKQSDQLAAVRLLLEYGHGKPAQPIEASGDVIIRVTYDDHSYV